MRKKLRIAAIIVGIVLLLIAGGIWGVYQGSRKVPEAYREAIQLDPVALREGSHEMFNQTAALVNDVKREGEWQALFTAEQINGWLAVDLVEKFPRSLPDEISDPRVAIDPDRIRLFCRFRRGKLSSVLTLTVEPYVPEPNVLALRVESIRAGLVPVPMDQVLAAISKAARKAELKLSWLQAEGDPVAMLELSPPSNDDDKLIQIEAVRLGDGELYLSGQTLPRE